MVLKFSTSILSYLVMLLYNLVWDLLNNRKKEMKINRWLGRKNVFVSALLLQGCSTSLRGSKLCDCSVKTIKEYNLTYNISPAFRVRCGWDLGWDDWSLFSLEYFMSCPTNEKECFPWLSKSYEIPDRFRNMDFFQIFPKIFLARTDIIRWDLVVVFFRLPNCLELWSFCYA